jgi:hypothetical protein
MLCSGMHCNMIIQELSDAVKVLGIRRVRSLADSKILHTVYGFQIMSVPPSWPPHRFYSQSNTVSASATKRLRSRNESKDGQGKTHIQCCIQNSRNQGFPLLFLLVEGSGSGAGSESGSVPLTNGSGSGSRRPKNTRILRIRIRNTAHYEYTSSKLCLYVHTGLCFYMRACRE